MTSKDNENPIIHSTNTTSLNSSRINNKNGNNLEWWRDDSIHTIHPNSFRHLLLNHEEAEDQEDETSESEDDELELQKVGNKMDGKPQSIDAQEVFDLIRSISDPEHPLTLEQLAVVNPHHITVHQDPKQPHVLLEFTPTIPHCSMATLIGLSLRVRLLRSLPPRYKLDIKVRPGTHQSEHAVNKQLNDKERVAAALENTHLLDVVQTCLKSAGRRGRTQDDAEVEIEAADGWEEEIERVARELGIQV